ncbi:MAG TPA: CRTAC1 family protein [Vicinamibacterales bacterium]|nr:CRTAC1 family protein [Vicinamibacterales bacterium]
MTVVSQTRQRIAWIAWTFLLVASLAAVRALNQSALASPPADEGVSDLRFGFQLAESAKRRGVDFVHEAPTFDSRLDHIMPQVASTGAAVAVADFDKDGWQDFYVTNSREGSLNRLYRNKGDGTFEDVAQSVGLADVNRRETGVSMGAVWGDYDNDGYEDLFLYRYGQPQLFHNERGQRFVVAGTGFPRWVNANAATWLDYDRDGLLDLFLAGYWPDDVDLWKLKTTRIMPDSFEYANNGGRKYLLRNRGDGAFEDTTAAVGITSRRWTLAVTAVDVQGSGYPGVFLANDYGVSEMFVNRGGTRFEDVAAETGVGRAPKSGMNAALGDVFNDGRLSIYKTNISEPGQLVQGNDLWVPKTAGSGLPAFENLATTLGVDLGGWSWGAQFGDLNNDGAQDIYLVNGYISAGERSSYWYDFSVIAVGHSSIIGDAANWPAMKGRSLSGYQRKRVWINDGFGNFTDVAQAVGATDTNDGRAVALADFRNTGVLDVVVANQRGPLLIYENRVAPGRHWIQFELEGTKSNRSAIGARVELHWNGHVQAQQVTAATGFSAQNQRGLHYGLGQARTVDRAVIRWPSGLEQTIANPSVDIRHHVKEPDGR